MTKVDPMEKRVAKLERELAKLQKAHALLQRQTTDVVAQIMHSINKLRGGMPHINFED